MTKALFSSVLLGVFFFSFSQNIRHIQTTFTPSTLKISAPLDKQYIWAETFNVFELSFAGLDAELNGSDIPHRDDESPSNNVILQIPNPNGGSDLYRVLRNTTMHPDLQATFPEIRTYDVVGFENRALRGKIDITPHGFHAMIFNFPGGTFFVDPVQMQNNGLYMVYYKKHFVTDKSMSCSHDHAAHLISASIIENGDIFQPLSYASCQLRKYRLALAARGEYTVFHGGTVALAQAAQVTSMNRVNGIFEKEIAITMEIIANNHLLIYLDPATDPFSGTDSELLTQTTANTNSVIGTANFDIGHLFSQGSNSGVAYKGVICNNGFKAGGVTGNAAPMGDPFDVDYVAHEMGHQYGADHTQNNNCNRVNATAVEPGSASTILGYAGICAPNVQSNSDAYFHGISLGQMGTHVSGSGGTCAVITNIPNQAPSISSTTGGITVPISTPFALTATASDPNGHTLSYRWEQINNEVSTQPPLANAVGGPNFRSFESTTNPTRFFPRLQTLASNGPYTWEVLPSVARTMNFRCTVHDNHVVGGCSDYVNTTVTFDATAGPFVVTYPTATGINWQIGSTQTVTWDVANTTNAAINCQFVNIFLSVDGGATYPHVLASNVPNSGSASVTVPNLPNNTSRVMVRSANGAFFDISNNNFSISSSVCNTYNSTNVPINIPASGTPTITSTLNVTQSGIITNVNVLNLIGTHTWVSDLNFSLTSPQGTTVTLFGGICGNQDNFNLNFSSSGLPTPIPCPPTNGQTYQPTGNLGNFIGQQMQGTWTLTVSDVFDGDGGQLQSWGLNICYGIDDYLLTTGNNTQSVCAGVNATYTVNVAQIGNYTSPVNLSISGLPSGASASWSTNPVTPGNNTTLTINTNGVATGSSALTVNATSASGNKTLALTLNVNNPPTAAINLTAPANNAIGVSTTPTFTWAASPTSGVTYQIDIATNSSFSNIVQTQSGITGTSYLATALLGGQTYHWRVRASNECGNAPFSSSRSFTTQNCQTYNSTNVPIAIPATGTPTITSTLNVTQSGTINNVNIVNLTGTHTWVSDLTISITSPQGTTVQLFTGICGSQDNFNLGFSSNGLPTPIPCPPTNGLTYQPTGNLGSLVGQQMQGTWTLTVFDGFNQDGGELQSWGLNICFNVDPCPTPSVAPSSINVVGLPFCQGGTLNLNQVGGSLAPGAQWEWFSGSCGGTSQGTGSSIQVSPTNNTTYFVRAGEGTGCPASTCAQVNVEVPQIGNSLSVNNDAATCVVNSGNWVHFYNAQGRLIASINSNGQNLGQVTANSVVSNNSYLLGACDNPTDPDFVNAVLARSFIINPQFQPIAPVTVRLYIQESEFLNYQTAAVGTANPNDNVQSINELHVTKHSNGNQTGVPSDICSGGGTTQFVLQSNSGNTTSIFPSIANSYFLEYQIDGFSQFFPMNSGNSPLPVALSSFTATCEPYHVEVNWTTSSENNASHYILETSRDGNTWLVEQIVQAAGNSSTATQYQVNALRFNNVTVYYRLKQVDTDGQVKTYSPIQVNCDLSGDAMSLFPNPTQNDFYLTINSTQNYDKQVVVFSDMLGKTAYSREITLYDGSLLIPFEQLQLAQGVYTITIRGLESIFEPIRLIISK